MTAQSAPAASHVVVAVFDGLRADMMRHDLTPNILKLAERGTWFREARSVFPSVTRVATTSVATGAPPSAHGVVGNAFYHPAALPERMLDTSRAAHIARAEAVHGGRFVTADTFGDQLARAGRMLAVVHTGSAGSAHLINPRARENGHWTFSVHGAEHTQTPQAVTEMIARFGPLPARALPRFPDLDYAADVMTGYVLPELQPDVALVWFNEPDTSFHYRDIGHTDSLAVLRAADAAFGRILEWIDARPDAERWAVIAASDHGQIATSGIVSLADKAREAGFSVGPKDRVLGYELAMTGGRNGEIRLLDADPSRLEAVAEWLMGRPEVSHVFSRGHNGVDGVARGSFAFDVVDNQHERQPDLAFALSSTDAPDAYGLPGQGLMTPDDVPLGGGMHGGLNRHELNSVLVLGLPGLAQGPVDRPAGVIDIGPTILDLLGVPSAASMRGVSLARPPRSEPKFHSLFAERPGFTQRIDVVDHDGRRFILRG